MKIITILFNKYFIHIILLLSLIIFFEVIFRPLGLQHDPDSDSYLYFVRDANIQQIPNVMRPLVYPLIVYMTSLPRFYPTLFHFQAFMISLAFVLLYSLAKRFLHNNIIIVGLILSCIFNYQSVQFINFMNPEATLSLEALLLVYFLAMTHNSSKYILPSVLCMVLLTFTKPIFLYFPVVILPLYWLLSFHNQQWKKRFKKLAVLLIIFYVIPVMGWSYGNKLRNDFFGFSIIRDINTIGKLHQYNLLDKGLEITNGLPIKRMISQYKNADPYDMMASIEKHYNLIGDDAFRFERALYKYGNQALRQNSPEYLIKSVFLIPKILTTLKEYPIHNDYPYVKKYFILEYNYYAPIASAVLPYILLLSTLNMLRMYQKLRKKTLTAYRFTYAITFTVVFYYIGMVSLGGYEQYSRLLSPLYFVIALLCFMTIYDCWQIILRYKAKYI